MKPKLSEMLGFDPPIKAKRFAKIISMMPGDCPYMMPEHLLPDADCDNCDFKQLPHPNAHCYMFEKKPGNKCGQFKPKA